MIILHNPKVQKSVDYVKAYGRSHKVLVWPELTEEERKSFLMMAGRPKDFPCVYDKKTREMVGKVSQAPTKEIAAEVAQKEEEKVNKDKRKAAKASIRQKKAGKLVEKLEKGQGTAEKRLARVEKALAKLIELVTD